MNKKKVLLLILLVVIIGIIIASIMLLNNIESSAYEEDGKLEVGVYNEQTGSSDELESTEDISRWEIGEIIYSDGESYSYDMANRIIIQERLFVSKIDDIYVSLDKYVGRMIEIEGYIQNDPNSDLIAVVREYYCCGDDSYPVGLESIYEGEEMPNNTWVKAFGFLETRESEYGTEIPILKLVKIEKIEEGERYVVY